MNAYHIIHIPSLLKVGYSYISLVYILYGSTNVHIQYVVHTLMYVCVHM